MQALKQSARKIHHWLYKIICKFRDALCGSLLQLFTESVDTRLPTRAPSTTPPSSAHLGNVAKTLPFIHPQSAVDLTAQHRLALRCRTMLNSSIKQVTYELPLMPRPSQTLDIFEPLRLARSICTRALKELAEAIRLTFGPQVVVVHIKRMRGRCFSAQSIRHQGDAIHRGIHRRGQGVSSYLWLPTRRNAELIHMAYFLVPTAEGICDQAYHCEYYSVADTIS
ncbi:hypothetical protein EDC04DRAFT_1252737 [Pisolithus marmoratus]|nr:hypothetical protein EDC04DRAFT_1252737 [Pisolithus marmoratus]